MAEHVKNQQEIMRAIWLVIDSQKEVGADAHTIHEMARTPGARGGFRPIDFSVLMFVLGLMHGMNRIDFADRDQPWTGEWSDVRWKTVPQAEWRE